jgi:polyphosphate kinase
MCAAALSQDQYINRELSWIAFNQRVLAQAIDQRTPLLDQAKFSAIFSNNLDEFFMVRVASLKSQVEAGISTPSEDGKTPFEQLQTIREHLLPLLKQQQEHYRYQLKQQLKDHNVQLLDYAQLNQPQCAWVDDYFQTSIFPVLTPLAVDPCPSVSLREQPQPERGSGRERSRN